MGALGRAVDPRARAVTRLGDGARAAIRATGWPAALAASVLVVLAPALRADRTLSFRDTTRLHAPLRGAIDGALRDGRLPLWNPHECLGKPLLAEASHSVLHPVSIAGALLAPGSVDFLALAYLVLAALGAYAVARSIGASPPASAGAGLAFALSGFTASMTGHLLFLAGAASFPWVVASARAAGRGASLGTAATALATAIALLSGDFQCALVGVAVGAALAAAAGGSGGLRRALAGAVVGAVLAGVQLAATWGTLAESTRAAGLASSEADLWALSPARLVEWLVPGLVRGELALARIPEVGVGGVLAGTFAESVYLGLPLLVLAAVGVAAPRAPDPGRRTRLVLGGAAIVLLWLALGRHLGAGWIAERIPVWNRFRYPEKLMAPLALCLSAAAALGVDVVAAARLPRRAAIATFSLAAIAAAALGLTLVAPGAVEAAFAGLGEEAARFLRENLQRGLPHAVASAVALAGVDRWARRARPALLACIPAAAAVAALPYAVHFGAAHAHAAATPLRLATDAPSPRIAQPYERRLEATAELDAVDVDAFLMGLVLTPALNVARGVDTIDCYGAFHPARHAALAAAAGPAWLRVARRYGLTHVVLAPPGDPVQAAAAAAAVEGGTAAEALEDPPVEAWSVPHRPWAFFADAVVPAADARSARDTALALAERGDDGTVVVETSSAPATAPGRVLSVARGDEEVRIAAQASGAALLVVNDAFWPGWRASVDGREVDVLRADGLVRAIPWPAGGRELVMRYDPPEVRRGLIASAAGALACAGLAASAMLSAARRRTARQRKDST